MSFQRTYGGAGAEVGFSVQQTTDGGYIVAGVTNSFGFGSGDVYLVKTNSSGDTLWTRTYGGLGDDIGFSVQQTADAGYVIAGYTYSFGAGPRDVYLVKTNSSGDTLWTRTYGGEGLDRGNSVQETYDGGYIITGSTSSFGIGGDVYLVKTNSSGDTIWTRTYGGKMGEAGYCVQQTVDGGYIIGGTVFGGGNALGVYLVKTNPAGDTLWTRTYDGPADRFGYWVKQTADGGYIIGGQDGFTGFMEHVYLIKTSSSGDTLWTRRYGVGVGRSVQQTSDGGYIIGGQAGRTGFMEGVYLVKTNSSGDTLWTRIYGGAQNDRGYSVQQTSDGGYVIGGYTGSFGVGVLDIYLIKTLGDGTVAVQDDNNFMPIGFALFQNYPNPFNSSTMISFSIPTAGQTSVKVYDILGREVAVLMDGATDAGRHELRWDARASSGVYVYRLVAGGFVDAKKMLLLK